MAAMNGGEIVTDAMPRLPRPFDPVTNYPYSSHITVATSRTLSFSL